MKKHYFAIITGIVDAIIIVIIGIVFSGDFWLVALAAVFIGLFSFMGTMRF